MPPSVSRWRLSTATISFSSTSRRASVVPMKPAPPVIDDPLSASEPRGESRRVLARYPGAMRGVVVLALVLVALVPLPGVCSGRRRRSTTSLRISYWEDGPERPPDVVWTLRCDPARGTRRDARACLPRSSRASGAKLFAPTPPDAVCTEIYGGPQTRARRRQPSRESASGRRSRARTAARSAAGSACRRGSCLPAA